MKSRQATHQNDFPEQRDSLARLALRSAEAADAIGVSERTLWSLTHENADDPIPIVRLGRLTLYPVEDLKRWLQRRTEIRKGKKNGQHRS